MARASWMIGSLDPLPAQSFTINGNAATFDALPYYLHHDTPSLSALAHLEGQMFLCGVSNPSARLTKDRRVRLSGDANFTVTWPGDSTLRYKVFGFGGDLSGSNDYVATFVSELLWSSGHNASPQRSPVDVGGHTIHDTDIVTSRDGTQTATTHYSLTVEDWLWKMALKDRVQTGSNLGGEFARWFDEVLRKCAKFMHFYNVEEINGSTDDAVLDTSFGPYEFRNDGRSVDWLFRRSAGFMWVEKAYEIEFSALLVSQYT